MPRSSHPAAVVLVGGGLHSALLALALLEARPDLRLTLLERAPALCGNHTWSFHTSDVPDALRPVVKPLVEASWGGYEVRFPERTRHVPIGYAAMTSTRVARVLSERLLAAPHAALRLGVEAAEVGARYVTLADGRRLEADLVVDARGGGPLPREGSGFQKFYGLEVRTALPHGLTQPLLMDATLPQHDGFRFLYVLPFGPRRLLVEDTVFSARPDLEPLGWHARLVDELLARGWQPERVLRSEQGVLPMPWTGRGPRRQRQGPLVAGYRGGWFHPATGYSVPLALRLAEVVAQCAEDPGALFQAPAYRALVADQRRQAAFARFLNRLLFTAVEPEGRWTIFQRFYGLPTDVIERFYRAQLSALDRARLLVGRPPRGLSLRGALAGSGIA